MAAPVRTLINVPKNARRGEVVVIKTLISHVMETGFRHNNMSGSVPGDIITSFLCTFNGEEIFTTTLYPAIAANPFITLRRRQSGTNRRQRICRGGFRRNHGCMSGAMP